MELLKLASDDLGCSEATYIDAPLGKEGKATLGLSGRVLREIFELVILVFVVTNVAITCFLASVHR